MGLDVGRAGRGGRALVAATLVAACLTGFQGAASAEEASQAPSGPDAGGGAAVCAGLQSALAGSSLDPAAAAQAEGDGAAPEGEAPEGESEGAPSSSAGAAADDTAGASGQPAAPEAAEPAEGEGGAPAEAPAPSAGAVGDLPSDSGAAGEAGVGQPAADVTEPAPDVTDAAADVTEPAADVTDAGDASSSAADAPASGDASSSAAEAPDADGPALPAAGTAAAEAAGPALLAAEAAPVPAAGWFSLAGGARGYRDALGSKVTGSVFADGAWRWFDPKTGAEARSATKQGRLYGKDGALVTGESSGRYYAPSTGTAAKSEFVEVAPGDVRRYGADGAAQTGAQWVDGAWRGFDSDGTMMTGLSDVGSRTYLYDAAGALQTGEIYAAGHWRYFDTGDGHMLSASECVQRVLARAYAHLGESEQDAWNLLWDAHVNHGAEWCEYGPCTATVWHFFAEAGMPHFFTGDLVPGWPHLAYDWLAARGRITWTPRVGEVVFFNYPDSFASTIYHLSAGHSEIITSVNADGSVTSIGALPGGILQKVLDMNYVVGYGVPEYYLY
jgi:glucan-binding YG repeat protein